MAQDSPAQPLLDWRDKIVSASVKMSNPIYRKDDPSWHENMVKQANESFRKQDKQKKISADTASNTSKKSAPKNTITKKKISLKKG
jgi:hypothetical protein